MCLGRNSRRIEELERKVKRLESQLLERTTVRKKYGFPMSVQSILSPSRLSITDAISAIADHLDIRFKFIAGERADDRWEIVEKNKEPKEE